MGKRFFTFALCFFCGFAFGQDYSNLIEKGKYAKVYQKCSKKLSKAPDDIELLYFIAEVTSRQEAGKLCDPLKSYTNYLKAVNLFNSTLDERRLEKLEKIPINSKAFKVLSDSIFTSGLAFAATANTEASYISYLNTYTLAGDYYKQIAKAERNRLAFATALSANSITAFTEFVYKYPDALQVTEAWSNVYRLAYLDAQSENTIQSYESFISKYPKAPQVGNANQAIHLLAFEEAKRVDNSSAYKNFIDTYPNSIQNAEATGLYQLRQFEENTVPGMWESYRDFYIKFTGPYKQIAIDSLKSIALSGELEAFDYLVNNDINISDEEEFYAAVFKSIACRGEYQEMLSFFQKHSMIFDMNNRTQFEMDLHIAKTGVDLKLEEPFNIKKTEEYIGFIKKSKDTDLAFVALQRLISKDIDNKKYENAIKTIESLEAFFITNRPKVKNLKNLLIDEYDLSIIPKKIRGLNTTGNEYSPVISADNKKMFFCGRNRSDNLGGEDIYEYYLHPEGNKNSSLIEQLSSKESNEAPICISADESEMLLFVNGKILNSVRVSNGWSIPDTIENLKSNSWQGDATISSNNQTMIFARSSYDINEETVTPNFKSIIKVQSDIKPLDLVNKYLLGEGIIASDIKMSDEPTSIGVFTEGNNANLPFESGIMISTGNIHNSAAYNHSDETSFSTGNSEYFNLKKLIKNRSLFDAAELTFEFVSSSDTMTFNYIFGSEEYPEFVCSEFNDVFGFFLTGPKPGGGSYNNENIAKLPGTNTFVCINSINNGIVGSSGESNNCELIDNNWRDLSTYYNSNESNAYGWELDGFTDKLSTGAKVIPGQKYTISIAIADVSDDKYDSYVILEKNSFKGLTLISDKQSFPKYHGDFQSLSDLYICHKEVNGEWGKPIPLSSSINTPYTERSPFLHPDMKTLYFSSDGHGGLGKLDLFMTRRLADSCWNCWSEPVNLGKEINSISSDWGYKISTDGLRAYFSKDVKSINREDIYSVDLPKTKRPDVVAKITGTLKDKLERPVSTNIRWEDIETNNIVGISKTNPIDGSYLIILPLGKNYGYFIEDSMYFPMSQNIDLRGKNSAVELKQDVLAISFDEMINDGFPVPMNNLFFEFGKHNVLPASIPELTRISGIIQRYNLKVEIAGHTDDVSDDKFNQQLSEKRADTVKDFLISRGCSKSLLVTKGYGESKPVAPNDSEENRAKNRRVELRFVK